MKNIDDYEREIIEAVRKNPRGIVCTHQTTYSPYTPIGTTYVLTKGYPWVILDLVKRIPLRLLKILVKRHIKEPGTWWRGYVKLYRKRQRSLNFKIENNHAVPCLESIKSYNRYTIAITNDQCRALHVFYNGKRLCKLVNFPSYMSVSIIYDNVCQMVLTDDRIAHAWHSVQFPINNETVALEIQHALRMSFAMSTGVNI